MSSTRKEFLAVFAAAPLAGAAAKGQPEHSQFARDFAARMREFDPSLTPAQLESIAAGIDGNLRGGEQVNPKGKALHNWDEPGPIFEAQP